MKTRLTILFFLVPVAAMAQVLEQSRGPSDPIFQPQQSANLLELPAERPRSAPPSQPRSPEEQEFLRAALVGKQVHAYAGGLIGTLADVAFDADGRPVSILVQAAPELAPGGANLPMPWGFVRFQQDEPTLVVPWNVNAIAWLLRGESQSK